MIRRTGKFFTSYESAVKSALMDPVAYWRQEAERVKWQTFPKTTLQVDDLHFYRWFPDGRINITEQCLDVHLQDRAKQVAYFVESPITGTVIDYPFRDPPSPTSSCMREWRPSLEHCVLSSEWG